MKEQERLIKNTFIIALGNISTKFVSFLLLPLYTKVLSTSEYGVLDYISSLCVFCVPFINLLMNETMFRYMIDCKTEDEKSEIISISIIISIIGSLIFTVVSSLIMCVLRYKYAVYFILYSLTTVLSNMISAALRGNGRTDYYALFNFSKSVFNIVLNIIFLTYLQLGVYGMLLAHIISHSIFSIYFSFKIKVWTYVRFNNIDFLKSLEMIRYSFPLIPNSLSWSIINLSDRLIIMNILGSNFSGLYAIAYKFPNLMDVVYGFFYQSWKESSARALHDSSSSEFYNNVYCKLQTFMLSLVLCMTSAMPFVFKLLIDDSYQAALIYVPILLFSTYFSNISGFYGGIFTAYKNTKIMGTTTLYAAVINIFINILLIKKYELYAAAISTFVASYVIYIYRKKKINLYITLSRDYSGKNILIFSTVLIVFLFYTMKKSLQFLGCIVSVLLFLRYNSDILIYFLRKLKVKK